MKKNNKNKKCYICGMGILPDEKVSEDEDGIEVHLFCLESHEKFWKEKKEFEYLIGY